jgi:hypothetical protein
MFSDNDRAVVDKLATRCLDEELRKPRPFGVKAGKPPKSRWFQHFSHDETHAASRLLQMLKDRSDSNA